MNRLAIINSQISNSYSYTKLAIHYRENIAYISLRSPKDLNCLSK